MEGASSKDSVQCRVWRELGWKLLSLKDLKPWCTELIFRASRTLTLKENIDRLVYKRDQE